jgi:serine/threonine protein kinase
MARLAHPHLATIHGVETWRGVPLLVVELLTGGTLADRLKSGPLPMSAVMEMAFSLTDVLHHIHDAAMVHRDIKPSNIGFTGSGTLKLLDFGLAQIFSGEDGPLDTGTVVALDTDTTHTAGNGGSRRLTGRFAGTPLYMSPEALDAARVAPGFDLWSTAVVLYEAAAGHHPFAGGTAEQVLGRIRRGVCVGVDALRTRCPAKFVDTLEACLSPDPQRRPDTARALRARLHAVRIAEAPAT